MPLIKNANANSIMRDAIALDLSDLHAQAERIIADARRESERIVAAARDEAKALRDSAAKTGRAEGRDAGFAEGAAEGREHGRSQALAEFKTQLEALARGWTEQLSSFERQRAVLFHQAQNDVVAFALRIAERIVHRSIRAHPETVVQQVRQALAFVRDPTRLRIVVHPDDLPIIEETLPQLCESIRAGDDTEIAADPSMARGGCRLLVPGGEVDATIERQIERVACALVPGGDGGRNGEPERRT